MSRDINPFGLRMPNELKESLERESRFNGRSLNLEIVDRLRKSIEAHGRATDGVHMIEQPPVGAYGNTPDLTDIERKLLTVFRRLPPEKQLALLSLFN